MANLASSQVTIVRSWVEGGPAHKDRVGLLCRLEDATSGIAAGGNSNTMPASAFGLTAIESCGNLLVYTTADGTSVQVHPMAPSYNGALLHAIAVTNATDANRANIADVTISTSQRGLIEIRGYR